MTRNYSSEATRRMRCCRQVPVRKQQATEVFSLGSAKKESLGQLAVGDEKQKNLACTGRTQALYTINKRHVHKGVGRKRCITANGIFAAKLPFALISVGRETPETSLTNDFELISC